MFESACQIKSLDNWTIVRRAQPNDLGITRGRLRKQVSIRSHQVGELHLRLVGIPAWAQYMPFEINGRGVVRRNRKDVNLVTILYSKTAQLGAHGFWIAGLSDLDAQHRALFMRHQPLHLDVSERRCGENSSRQVKRVLQRRFTVQFIERWPAYHAINLHHGTKRWHQERIAVFKASEIPADSVEQQVVGVHLLNQLLSSVVFEPSQRALLCHTSRCKQRVDRRGKRTHVIRAWRSDVADNIDPDCAQTLQRHISRNIAKLRPQYALHFLLNITKGSSGNQDRPNFGQ